jgi:hypothetical protein
LEVYFITPSLDKLDLKQESLDVLLLEVAHKFTEEDSQILALVE